MKWGNGMSSSVLQSTLFLLVPLFSIAIVILASSHTPAPLKPQAKLAYIYIASVTLLSTLAGALPLSRSSSSFSESFIQALLFFFIGIPVLHLAPAYVPKLSIRTIHTSILVITLSIATLLALISPFLPAATPLLYIPPSLFLLYTIQAIPRIAYILHNFLYPEDSIQIPVQFHNTIPLTLPSPASTTSFPFSTDEIRKQHHHHKIPSVSTTSTITIVDYTRISFPCRPQQGQLQEPNDQLRSQIVNSRSRSLLVFVLAVQLAAFTANACALGVTIAVRAATTLKTVQTACTVLAVTGSMSAYLLHTYNLHLRQTPTTPSTHSPAQLQMMESQQHHSTSHSPRLIQLAPPPLQKARHKRANAGVSMEKNPFSRLNNETIAKSAPTTNSDLEELDLELDVVMDISRYSMTLGRSLGLRGGTTRTQLGSGKKDAIDLGLALVSSPACTPLPAPLALRVSVEEASGRGSWGGVESGGGGVSDSALEKQKESEKEKIQGYYLSASTPSTGSPSSPLSPFERYGMETETDPSSPDTPYPNLHLHPNMNGGSLDDDARSSANVNPVGNTNTIATQVRKRSSFFGWEFAWDQEALERADDAGKLRNATSGRGSPIRWKSNVNANTKLNADVLNSTTSNQACTGKKIQPLSFVDLGGDPESFPSLSHSLSSELEVGAGRVKRGMSWRSSVCGVVGVGGERVKRKNTLGMEIGMKPLRLSRSFGGRSNNSNGCETGSGRGMGHRAILSGDAGPMCGLSLKRRATVLVGGQGSPVTPSAVSSRAMKQGPDATRTTTAIRTPTPTPKRLTKKTKSGLSAATGGGTSPSTEFKMGENPLRNSKNKVENHSIGFIHDSNRNLDSDDSDLNEDADLQKTPTMKSRTTTRSYSHSPQSYCYSSSSSPKQQQLHEAATSESHCSSITATANTNSPPKLSPSLTRRGLSLKRSFKMGSTVGRTLGPGLTLSSAGSGSGPPLTLASTSVAHRSMSRCESERFGLREEKKRECEEKEKCVVSNGGKSLDNGKVEIGEGEEGVNVAEMKSLVATRLVSNSYARATRAATILTPTGAGVGVGSGGFASRSGVSGSPVNHTAPMLHSRPSLPIMNTTTTATSASACPTIVEQHQPQYRYRQDGYISSVSTATSRGYVGHNAWRRHPFVDWFRPSEVSNDGHNDVISLEKETETIKGSSGGNDNERLSSLPLPRLLLPPMISPSPPQSQSLPPTPTRSRSTLLIKSSMSSLKKRSAPPALPPLPISSEWALFPHSTSTTNRVGGMAAASMVSLAHSRSNSGSHSVVGPGQGQRPPSQPPSRPTTPRPSTRLSAMNMGTVRSAFAGVGAKVSARMSINSASTRGGVGAAGGNAVASSMRMGIDDIDGDFMDLRDPFASPPLASVSRGRDRTGREGSGFWVSERATSSLRVSGSRVAGSDDDDDDDVEVGMTRRISSLNGERRNMNAWGRLPMPSTSPLPSSAPGTSNTSVSAIVASRKKAHSHHGERRKHKKEKWARKAATAADNGVLDEANSSLDGAYHGGEEDADFDVEEALLSQRLLKRLDSVEWD